MKIKLDVKKNVFENAARYFEDAKTAKHKAESLIKARKDLLAKAASASKPTAPRPQARVVEVRKREWFEKYHYFTTSGGRLCIAGRDAKQNEAIYSRYMDNADLFFHADIQGAPFTLLKDGVNASLQELAEAAQLAASYSSAWKRGYGVIDVYSARKEQLSKTSQGEYVAKGGFVVKGRREWHRNTELRLAVGLGEYGPVVVPALSSLPLEGRTELLPGAEKTVTAKKLALKLGLDAVASERLLQLLP
ncbi:hypothetical protein AUJ14_01460 [Candidatus Micrarchaeota archaeon CG1_02_55_22]|nr:MAG: hypothetical protein AUJ14_01460 [Candidatus Micrarchaeota archaeon CG1_02_55_22]